MIPLAVCGLVTCAEALLTAHAIAPSAVVVINSERRRRGDPLLGAPDLFTLASCVRVSPSPMVRAEAGSSNARLRYRSTWIWAETPEGAHPALELLRVS